MTDEELIAYLPYPDVRRDKKTGDTVVYLPKVYQKDARRTRKEWMDIGTVCVVASYLYGGYFVESRTHGALIYMNFVKGDELGLLDADLLAFAEDVRSIMGLWRTASTRQQLAYVKAAPGSGLKRFWALPLPWQKKASAV